MTPPRMAAAWVRGLLLAAVASALACEGDRAARSPESDVAPRVITSAPKIPAVVFLTAHGEVGVRVDVARTQAQKTQGLMFVEHLAAWRGMLFLMGPPDRQLTFWMKNTLIPLDMIFINARLEIVGIVESAEPLTTTPRTVDAPSSYVVEVNGGWAAEKGVATGDKVRFENID